ncbi:tRNA pseudouridine38-40 synthase [Halomicrobium zhouii]|uniref:tRNA pseudouridine synthase A n=1 Tax=Halomicrobium zhouii TaxID=767519 RepID=A0A1I6KFC1_9EURY|nr:tRNA pseudouridine(38-40) synthase TruA [Halomicrobium zhouii]SFR89854.1 tRNA pseudouridine38-40 synthase [Halomicrobium zhouii]
MRAYRVAYDGRPYYGFQRQPDVPTVEDVLFDALGRLGAVDGDEPPAYAGAGRTDAGVSALAQTVAFDAPEWLTPAAFNSELPADVRVWASADVSDSFHATHDALAREYLYHLYAPDADDALAGDAVAALAGEHDFHNLTPDERGTVRTLETDVERDGEFLIIRLRAGGFARHMVRRAVGLIREVVGGEATLARIQRVLSQESLSGPAGVPTASAAPLVLWDVAYDVEFALDPEAAASARSVFSERRVEHATNARVAGSILDGLD